MTGDSDALAAVRAAYASFAPDEVALHVEADTVGVIGSSVPTEVIRAAGMRPLRLPESTGPTPLADQHLSSSTEPWIAAAYDLVRGRRLGALRHLVIANEGDSTRRLYFHLAELSRSDPDLPAVHFVDLQRQMRDSSARYSALEVRALAAKLGEWAGRDVADADLAHEVRAGNRHRASIRTVLRLRERGARLRGTDALAVVGSAEVMAADEHQVQMASLTQHLEHEPTLPGIPVYLTGSPISQPDVYRAIEREGLVVVGEDHDWGTPFAELIVSESDDPVGALAEGYRRGRGTAGSAPSISERVERLVRGVADTGAVAVIGVEIARDLSPRWDWPDQSGALAERGVPGYFVSDLDPAHLGDSLPRVAERVRIDKAGRVA